MFTRETTKINDASHKQEMNADHVGNGDASIEVPPKRMLYSFEGAPMTDKTFHVDDSVKKWFGFVVGDKEDIREALTSLSREPKDKKELQEEINKHLIEKIDATAKESRKPDGSL